jgi:uncharacterized protein (TIGR02266 family)
MSKVSVQQAEAARERRRTHRAELMVRVDYGTVDELFSEFTRDINEGGLFIETERPHPPGTAVSMQFNLPGSQEPVRTTGRVVHVVAEDGDQPPGMGIEFDDLDREARGRIDELIRALRTGRSAA